MEKQRTKPDRNRKESLPVFQFQKFINPFSKKVQFKQRILAAAWLVNLRVTA